MPDKNERKVVEEGRITRGQREALLGQQGRVLWFTGYSGSGKTTLSTELERRLHDRKVHCFTLDGDLIRRGLNSDLGFSVKDRTENIRRIGEVAKLFADTGLLVLVAFISPFRKDRDRVRHSMDSGRFIEIYLDCPLQVCERRDTKGLYRKARAGEIPDFTGISSPYEPPPSPEIHLRTDQGSPEDCVRTILDYLEREKVFLENPAG